MDKELVTILKQLAKLNYSGIFFLFCYGVTWNICGVLWIRVSNKIAAYATLFQGLVALPFALIISYFLGSFVGRPGGEIINQLSVLIAMSQLLVLPILIVFHIKKQYSFIPFIFSMASSIHFIFYTWLYQTILYVIMSLAISIGSSVIYYKDTTKHEQIPSTKAASVVCFFIGSMLITTGLGLLLI